MIARTGHDSVTFDPDHDRYELKIDGMLLVIRRAGRSLQVEYSYPDGNKSSVTLAPLPKSDLRFVTPTKGSVLVTFNAPARPSERRDPKRVVRMRAKRGG